MLTSRSIRKICGVLLVLWLFAGAIPAHALSLIRDDETETYLRELATPVFRAAGLHPDAVRLLIVNDPELNAFVSGGQNLFLHTGVITWSDDPLALIGVVAHEAGHISGGHLIKKTEEAEEAGIQAILGYVLGIASVAAGAPPDAAAAIMGGGQHAAQRNFLKYSRAHEQEADQAALHALQKLGVSPRGLYNLLEALQKEQSLLLDKVNPYALTHPLSNERMQHIKQVLEQEMRVGRDMESFDSVLLSTHRRIVWKLRAFLEEPEKILEEIGETPDTLPKRYARVIALYRLPDIEQALTEVNALIEAYPEDPYFQELKGQMLFEHGRIRESIPAYQAAVALKPDAPLLLMELGVAHIASDTAEDLQVAVLQLEQTVVKEPRNAAAWEQLGIAYGRLERLAHSYYALAEKSYLLGQKKEALEFVARAEKYAESDTAIHQKLQDLKNSLNKKK